VKGGLRIVAGACRGHRLVVPRGTAIRPTSERIRESLFASLTPYLAGARFADLFAGTGAVGLEALSRGAERSVLVESNPACLQAIRANVAKLELEQRTLVVGSSVETAWPRLAQVEGPFDVVFLDPPYAYPRWAQLAELVLAQALGVAPDGLVIIQHARQEPPPLLAPPRRCQRFGESELTWFRPASAAGEGPPDD
jgi:16S rRNA (guanine966-N2)-methyltransferase